MKLYLYHNLTLTAYARVQSDYKKTLWISNILSFMVNSYSKFQNRSDLHIMNFWDYNQLNVIDLINFNKLFLDAISLQICAWHLMRNDIDTIQVRKYLKNIGNHSDWFWRKCNFLLFRQNKNCQYEFLRAPIGFLTM